MDVAPVTKSITQDSINGYADASGDHNPVHVDEAFARTTPFGSTIAHGMLVLASVQEMLVEAFGERWLSSGRLRVRFKAPARPGDTVTASASLQKEGDASQTYAVEVTNQDGETLVSGTAEVRA
jgi:3-hydroxybutyryl-CoA dehydratase